MNSTRIFRFSLSLLAVFFKSKFSSSRIGSIIVLKSYFSPKRNTSIKWTLSSEYLSSVVVSSLRGNNFSFISLIGSTACKNPMTAPIIEGITSPSSQFSAYKLKNKFPAYNIRHGRILFIQQRKLEAILRIPSVEQEAQDPRIFLSLCDAKERTLISINFSSSYLLTPIIQEKTKANPNENGRDQRSIKGSRKKSFDIISISISKDKFWVFKFAIS